MPQVVVVDEIGTEAEALACRTIAERGVQLIGTAHGCLLENLIKNPTLADLVGGVAAVTLGDEEARARGTQKTVSGHVPHSCLTNGIGTQPMKASSSHETLKQSLANFLVTSPFGPSTHLADFGAQGAPHLPYPGGNPQPQFLRGALGGGLGGPASTRQDAGGAGRWVAQGTW